MSKSNVFRYIGNILLLSGYFFLLWGDMKIGLFVKCIGNVFVVPFAIKYKFWDILFLCGFYAAIEIMEETATLYKMLGLFIMKILKQLLNKLTN